MFALLLFAQAVRRAFDGYLEMPAVAPAAQGLPHRYVYGYHSVFEDPQIGVAKVDTRGRHVDIWLPGPRRFALEPRFVPRPGGYAEDDGWLVAQLFDSERGCSEVVILEAGDLGRGPVAVLRLRDALPSALHSCWAEEYYGPDGGGGDAAAAAAVNVVPFSAAEAARLRGTGQRRPATSPSRRLLGALPLALAQLLRGGGGAEGGGGGE
jgi:hypothetical protein